MTLARGRVVPAERVADASALPALGAPEPRVVPRGATIAAPVVDAHAAAQRLLAAARAEAHACVEAARAASGDVRQRAAEEGRAEGVASLAAREIELAARVARADAGALDRVVELATLLAERLLGEALAVEPRRVTALARQALTEARGAQRVRVVAHPEDAALLSGDVARLGVPGGAIEIVASAARERGSVRLETDVGVIDGELAPQLARLASALRAALGGEPAP
ncbi:MAG: hypothetical protein IT376_11560 [Polyangiaceae bacterium]|nr:hypothetical protein [Polyangiaceae bacterium]